MAFGAIAAIAAGSATAATVTAAMVLTTVSTVGMALSVVGMVTGNESLMKIGGAMSLVGGVGGLVNGMASGAAGAAASTVGEGAANAVGNAAGSGADLALNGSDLMSDAFVQGSGAGSFQPLANAGMPDLSAGGMPSAPPSGTPSNLQMDVGSQAAGPGDAGWGQDLGMDVAPANTAGNTLEAAGTNNPYSDARNGTWGDMSSTVAPVKSTSLLDGFMKLGSNKDLMNMLSGAAKGRDQDKQLALKKRELDIMQQRVNQTSYGNQVHSYRPSIIAGART